MRYLVLCVGLLAGCDAQCRKSTTFLYGGEPVTCRIFTGSYANSCDNGRKYFELTNVVVTTETFSAFFLLNNNNKIQKKEKNI